MGIGIKNISVHSGYSYAKYLQDQLKEIQEAATNQKAYNSQELGADNMTRYTRCTGALADQWGLSGTLTPEKLATIADLELGKDERTSKHVKILRKVSRTVKGEDGIDVVLTKADVKIGFYLDKEDQAVQFKPGDVKQKFMDVRKSAIETTYTLDSSFSYLYQLLNDQQKQIFEQDFLDSAAEARRLVLEPLMKSSTGENGKTLSYSFMHKDSRDGLPFLHIHEETSNLIELSNGQMRAIEIPEIREADFHESMDSVFKSIYVEKFKQSFPELSIESYDKDGKSVTNDFQNIKDWRVAFNEKSLEAIREKSTAKENTERFIGRERQDLVDTTQTRKQEIETSFQAGKISANQHMKKIEGLNKAFEKQVKFLNSSKHKNEVHQHLKLSKKSETVAAKDERTLDVVQAMRLEFKKTADVGMVHNKRTDEQILDSLTNINPTFTRNALITEATKTYGMKATAKADAILGRLMEKDQIINCGYRTAATKQEQFTLMSLCEKEVENVKLMKAQFRQVSKKTVDRLEEKIEEIQKRTGILPENEQKEFIRSVFNQKNASIVVGVPGAGKSLAASWATEIANEAGYRTIGIAPTGKVASALANETSVNHAMTVDKLNLDIKQGKFELTSNDIIFMDESSMVGTRNWNTLLKNLNGAKIVSVGDPNQIQSVSAGSTLNEFMRDKEINHEVKYLTEIRRQKDAVAMSIAAKTSLKDEFKSGDYEDKKASGLHVQEAMNIMKANAKIRNEFTTTSEKVNAISEDYLLNVNQFKNKIIVASTNDSIDRLNECIQDKRLKAGAISGESLKNGKESFYVGDRVVMKKNEKLAFNNGDFGTITSIKDGRATIKLDNNKTKEVAIDSNSKIGLSYATSIHKSQGKIGRAHV